MNQQHRPPRTRADRSLLNKKALPISAGIAAAGLVAAAAIGLARVKRRGSQLTQVT